MDSMSLALPFAAGDVACQAGIRKEAFWDLSPLRRKSMLEPAVSEKEELAYYPKSFWIGGRRIGGILAPKKS